MQYSAVQCSELPGSAVRCRCTSVYSVLFYIALSPIHGGGDGDGDDDDNDDDHDEEQEQEHDGHDHVDHDWPDVQEDGAGLIGMRRSVCCHLILLHRTTSIIHSILMNGNQYSLAILSFCTVKGWLLCN